jgi:hypothetical protein
MTVPDRESSVISCAEAVTSVRIKISDGPTVTKRDHHPEHRVLKTYGTTVREFARYRTSNDNPLSRNSGMPESEHI